MLHDFFLPTKNSKPKIPNFPSEVFFSYYTLIIPYLATSLR